MKIEITAPYLWLPVQKDNEEIRIHIYAREKKIREFDICLGNPRCDFYAYIDVEHYMGQELDIVADVAEEKLNNIFCYKEKPQNVYPFRPQLHFAPPVGWNNDPNGLVYKDGIYHLYYQWNPFGVEWGNMQWGHAISRDLIHWEHKKEALVPNETGQMYSGCAIVDEEDKLGYGKGSLLFYYTAAGGMNDWSKEAGNTFTQRLAYSTDNGESLQFSDKFLMNNIERENRDPKVFYHEESQAYIMVLYLDESEFGIYRSTDLIHWEKTQKLEFEEMWECPDLFELSVVNEDDTKKWIFWSADGYYVVGTFDGYEFLAESEVKKAYVGVLPYAAQTYSNIKDRVVSISWIRILNDWGNYRGLMSIPQELSLKKVKDEYMMQLKPVRELEQIEPKRVVLEDAKEGFSFPLEGRALKLSLRWKQEEKRKACIYLKNIIIYIDFKKGMISLEQMSKNTPEMIGYFDNQKEFDLDLIIDQEIIEFYGADGIVYGAMETDENILGYKLICESEPELGKVEYCQYEKTLQ